jgi:hypothetical protein
MHASFTSLILSTLHISPYGVMHVMLVFVPLQALHKLRLFCVGASPTHARLHLQYHHFASEYEGVQPEQIRADGVFEDRASAHPLTKGC